jgi:hypothetical protein
MSHEIIGSFTLPLSDDLHDMGAKLVLVTTAWRAFVERFEGAGEAELRLIQTRTARGNGEDAPGLERAMKRRRVSEEEAAAGRAAIEAFPS